MDGRSTVLDPLSLFATPKEGTVTWPFAVARLLKVLAAHGGCCCHTLLLLLLLWLPCSLCHCYGNWVVVMVTLWCWTCHHRVLGAQLPPEGAIRPAVNVLFGSVAQPLRLGRYKGAPKRKNCREAGWNHHIHRELLDWTTKDLKHTQHIFANIPSVVLDYPLHQHHHFLKNFATGSSSKG